MCNQKENFRRLLRWWISRTDQSASSSFLSSALRAAVNVRYTAGIHLRLMTVDGRVEPVGAIADRE
jgi:hypothetical protein